MTVASADTCTYVCAGSRPRPGRICSSRWCPTSAGADYWQVECAGRRAGRDRRVLIAGWALTQLPFPPKCRAALVLCSGRLLIVVFLALVSSHRSQRAARADGADICAAAAACCAATAEFALTDQPQRDGLALTARGFITAAVLSWPAVLVKYFFDP